MKSSILLLVSLLTLLVSVSSAQTLTKIKSGDGLEIAADLY